MSQSLILRLANADFTLPYGEVSSIRSDWILTNGPSAKVGDFCSIESETRSSNTPIIAEVVAVSRDGLRLVPLSSVSQITQGARVTLSQDGPPKPKLELLRGRAVDALGRPIDNGQPFPLIGSSHESPTRLAPLQRTTPSAQFHTGIRAIDGLLPLGQGQKIGVFAPSGAGKSTLLEQLYSNAECDRIIFCQVGERGREVEKAWRLLSKGSSRQKFTLIAATADESPSMRIRAFDLAIALAEQARSAGEHVVLLVDSVTRVAMALRELGIAAGEPPSARGYTSNVFSYLPRQIERCGAAKSGGAITAIMSVLSETDDVDDPIVEMMKSILDGHIVLSRSLAEKRHFPAIDISRSVSRLVEDIASADQSSRIAQVFRLHAAYEEARPMIESGIYTAGSNAKIDLAISAQEAIGGFLRQSRSEISSMPDTLKAMQSLGGAHVG